MWLSYEVGSVVAVHPGETVSRYYGNHHVEFANKRNGPIEGVQRS